MTAPTRSGARRRRALPWLAAVAVVAGLPTLPPAGAQVATTTPTGASAWGLNSSGQLGDGTKTGRRTAVAVRSVGPAVAVAAGDVHSLALDTDGAVWGTGSNAYGQLGNGTTTLATSPVKVGSLVATAVAAGQHFSLAVRTDGTVAAWGRNSSGQLGNGVTTTAKLPVTVSQLRGAVAVAAGDLHSLALVDGQVWAWGYNGYGQLGDGTATTRRTPVRVSGLSDVVAVAAGGHHSLAVRADGTVWSWGHNSYGQLGDGTVTARRLPVQVVGLTDATAIAAGDFFSTALQRDGKVRSWGRNASGQLGDGTITTRRTPVTVSGISTAVRVAAGDNHVLAALGSGQLRAWGANNGGQLGDGTVTTRRTPVAVGRLTAAGAVAAGTHHSLTASPPPLTGPQPDGWWSGESDTADGAGDATLVASAGIGYALGAAGCGFVVPTGEQLDAPDSPALEAATSFTVAGWIAPADVSGTRTVVAKVDGTRTAWSLAVVDGHLRVTTSSDGVSQRTLLSADPVVAAGRTTHVAVVFDGALTEVSRVRLHVDGALVPNAAFAPLTGPVPSIADLGGSTRFGGPGWDGGLDELRLFASPLSVTQVGETRAEDLARADEGCDRTAPVTTATPSVPANDAGWHRGPVDLALQAVDGPDGTGVASLTWSTAPLPEAPTEEDEQEQEGGDGGTLTAPSADAPTEPVGQVVEGGSAVAPVTLDGTTTIYASATDKAGNAEAQRLFTVRVDSVPPTLVGTPAPAAGTWTAGPVTVTWTCEDALSGVVRCPAPTTVSADGADQSVTATALDAAGNETTVTVGDLDVDATAPVLSGALDAAGAWANDDVTVTWTATDTLSGVDPTAVPEPTLLTGEGPGLTASASVVDRAGNAASAVSPAIGIDRTAPLTTAVAPDGWSQGRVVVELDARDALSGVDATWWSLDGSEPRRGTAVVVEGDGRHVLRWFSVDVAGNVEPTREVRVDVDATAPRISAALSKEPNAAGWHAAPVTVSFTCEDGTSGVSSCSEPVLVDSDVSARQVRGEAVDVAGNRATADATVSLDRTPPVVTAAADRAPDANGWYAAPVEVGFACSDALSGVVACPSRVTLGEGAGQPASGTAADAAGNRGGGGLAGLDVDLTPPVLRGDAGDLGSWRNADVTVRWSCSDALSGVDGDCPADTVLTGEGVLAATETVRDVAGHSTTSVVDGVRIDRTSPVTTAEVPAPLGAGWHGSSVSVTLAATDALSGVVSTEWSLDGSTPAAYDGPLVVSGDGVRTLVFSSTDAAGNVEAERMLVLTLDGTPPTITPVRSSQPNDAGWHAAPVEVGFACADAQSGVASCTRPVLVSTDGPDQLVAGTAVDRAGNRSSAETRVSVDTVAPVVALGGPGAGRAYVIGETVPELACTATDAGSGLAGDCTVTTVEPVGGLGTWTATATATDVAGHTSTATLTWSVAYGWGGWAAPLSAPGRNEGGTVTAKAGSTLPVSLTLTDSSGRTVLPRSAPVWVVPQPASSFDPAATGTAMALQGGRYRTEWKTPRDAAGTTWVAGVRLDDGTVRTVRVELR